MGVHIKFSMEHRYFKDWLEVDVDWNYPFLPRVGEFGKHGKIDPVGTDEIDPVKTA